MGESACVVEGTGLHKMDIASVLRESVSFGRFMTEPLEWGKWSSFSQNRYIEEAERYSTQGSVAQKKAYFEERYKRAAAKKEAEQFEKGNESSSCTSTIEYSEKCHEYDQFVLEDSRREEVECKANVMDPQSNKTFACAVEENGGANLSGSSARQNVISNDFSPDCKRENSNEEIAKTEGMDMKDQILMEILTEPSTENKYEEPLMKPNNENQLQKLPLKESNSSWIEPSPPMRTNDILLSVPFRSWKENNPNSDLFRKTNLKSSNERKISTNKSFHTSTANLSPDQKDDSILERPVCNVRKVSKSKLNFGCSWAFRKFSRSRKTATKDSAESESKVGPVTLHPEKRSALSDKSEQRMRRNNSKWNLLFNSCRISACVGRSSLHNSQLV